MLNDRRFLKIKTETSSPTKICRDTIDWTNGWDCESKGYTKAQGCLPTGWTCDKYSKAVTSKTGHKQQTWCTDGAPLPGFPGQFGKEKNHPENNCCICGKTEGISALTMYVCVH